MPWLRDTNRSRNIIGRGPDNGPPGRVEAAVAEGERLAAQPDRNRQAHLKSVLEVVRRATNGSILDLVNAHRMGYVVPTTDTLLKAHGKPLSKAARAELRGFIDEVRPAIVSGDYGRPRQAVREFVWEVAEAAVNEGWQPAQRELDPPGETPEALAALVPRG